MTYRYNGDDLLYERVANGQTTRYYWDGDRLLAEAAVNGSQVTPKVSYIYGNELLAQIDAATLSRSHYLLNGHQDVVELRDNAGNVQNSYTYDIWGKPLTETETVYNPFRYSSEFWDGTTSLQYLRARWYDPQVGRFITEDTYNPLSLNLYTYVLNNPVFCFFTRCGIKRRSMELEGTHSLEIVSPLSSNNNDDVRHLSERN